MTRTPTPQNAFAAAERAYAEGRYEAARDLLATIAHISHPVVHHLRAIVLQELGNLALAREQFLAAARLAPRDPQIWNNFGNLLSESGDERAALDAYERSLALAPGEDAAFNRANLLRRLGRLDEAREALLQLIRAKPSDPRYWNGLAALERASGDLAAAASAYDRALDHSPRDRLATIGRARVALEREEPEVIERYRAARGLAPDDPELALDEAEARLGRGDRSALDDLADLARSAPDWTRGQIALGRMRWEQGDRTGFADHIETLLEAEPTRRQLWTDYILLLAECGQPDQAADAAGRARRALDDDDAFRLAEAIHAGKAGEVERAEALFENLAPEMSGRAIHEAVHRIRRGELDRAIRLVEAALGENHWDYASWGIAELLYRKVGDVRAEWLSGQAGLVSVSELTLSGEEFRAVDSLLLDLHRDTVETVGQSVLGGTQTRWRLFDRTEPELARLRLAIEHSLMEHLADLPDRDEDHPLLRHRDRRMTIGPSWSVRFIDAGFHISHYHPKGLISSACYFRTPEASSESHQGWLEIGRPPADFLMDLEPIQLIEPRPGRLVLFPSYLFHGTRPFSAGERMSVAFDIVAKDA